MALQPCKECKAEVSSKAKTCPHCGVSNPTTKTSDVIKGIAILAAIVGLVYACSSPSDEKKTSSVTSTKTPEQIKLEEEACKKELACWAEKHLVAASVYCKSPIEKLAKYNAKWTDGLLEQKMSHYRWLDQKKGTVTFIGDKIQFQNGFGAYQNYIYYCDFDPATERPIRVNASPGTIPN